MPAFMGPKRKPGSLRNGESTAVGLALVVGAPIKAVLLKLLQPSAVLGGRVWWVSCTIYLSVKNITGISNNNNN